MERNDKGQFVRGASEKTYGEFGIWYDSKGYPIIHVDGKDVKLHVYIWECANGPKPKGYEIHHGDLNKQNYDLSNLQILSNSDHQKIHAGWVKENGEWVAKPCNRCKKILSLNNFYSRKGHTPSALCKACHNIVIAAHRGKEVKYAR